MKNKNEMSRIKKIEKLINEVIDLDNNVPDGIVRDADTILADVIEESDLEVNGLAQNVLEVWRSASDKKAFEDLFVVLTDVSFEDFLKRCKREISREGYLAYISVSERFEAGKEPVVKEIPGFNNREQIEDGAEKILIALVDEAKFSDGPIIARIDILEYGEDGPEFVDNIICYGMKTNEKISFDLSCGEYNEIVCGEKDFNKYLDSRIESAFIKQNEIEKQEIADTSSKSDTLNR